MHALHSIYTRSIHFKTNCIPSDYKKSAAATPKSPLTGVSYISGISKVRQVSNPARGDLIKIFSYVRNQQLLTSAGCNFVIISVSYRPISQQRKPCTLGLHHNLGITSLLFIHQILGTLNIL